MEPKDLLTGRIIETAEGVFFLCKDGSVSQCTTEILNLIFTNFKSAELISGSYGRWDHYTSSMAQIPGVDLAYIYIDRLVIFDSSIFNIIKTGIHHTQYITALEYANNHNRSVSQIKKLCKENRIAGAVKLGRQWLIPKNAAYPSFDRRKFNNEQPSRIRITRYE